LAENKGLIRVFAAISISLVAIRWLVGQASAGIGAPSSTGAVYTPRTAAVGDPSTVMLAGHCDQSRFPAF